MYIFPYCVFCSRNRRKRHSARSPNETSWSKCTADVDRHTRQFRWSITCCLKLFSWLLDHVNYLKLTNFLLLLQAKVLHKIHSKWSWLKKVVILRRAGSVNVLTNEVYSKITLKKQVLLNDCSCNNSWEIFKREGRFYSITLQPVVNIWIAQFCCCLLSLLVKVVLIQL